MPDPTRLMELLNQWQSALREGRSPSIAELCGEDAELAQELSRQIEQFQTLSPATERGIVTSRSPGATIAQFARPGELSQGTLLSAQADFESVRVLGKGGIGIVYVANDRSLNREVAVKLMRAEVQDDNRLQVEMVREAEVTGKLEHPGVVPVYGLGRTDNGQTFYVMRLIQGSSLETAIGEFHSKMSGPSANAAGQRNLDFRNLLSRFVSVCYTVAYAHNRGVIHRDIKPENIMLGKYGETLLVDWGLAMPVDRDEQARASGERTLMLKSASQSGNSSGFPIGTPAYMSPEQAEATGMLTPATDVYSLGATLYKLLTNDIACKGKDIFEVLKRVKTGDIDRPSAKEPNVQKELEAICLKAMARIPSDRYANPLDLAADIEHWLADEPVSVLQETRAAHFGRWLRRHRAIAFVAGAGVLALLIATMVAAIGLRSSADRERVGREENLRLAAKFASRLIANEIDLRWRILEKEADDPQLALLLEGENAKPDGAQRKPLQDWLNQVIQEYQKTDASASWFIVDRKGNMVALAGPGINAESRSKAMDKNFAHRDYFHGQGKDLDPKDAAGIAPIGQSTLSAVYKSTTDKIYKVAFSVPIQKEVGSRRETIGILAMTFKVGQFEALRAMAKKDQMSVLIDTRNDYLDEDKSSRQGLVLHHRQLAKRQLEKADQNVRIAPAYLKHLLKLRAARIAADSAVNDNANDEAADFDNLERNYVDPLASGETWTAAAEPVIIQSRSGKMRDTGWVVIVQGK
jgi:serine/threonine protein kinase